jgi:hypothetical protein
MAGAIGFMLRRPHKFPGRQHGSIDDAVARAFASGQKRMARRKADDDRTRPVMASGCCSASARDSRRALR